jgi:TonB family protein
VLWKERKLAIGLGLMAVSLISSPRVAFAQEPNPQAQAAARKVAVKVEPQYPDLARRNHIFGKVRIQAVVAPDGTVKEAHEIGGGPVLVKAALEAVGQWKFEPASKETTELIEIAFNRDDVAR